MSHNELSKNECLTLYGLIKYSLLNDKEIAEKVGVKHSTFTAIKVRLRKENYYYPVRMPYLQVFDYEMLAVTYAKFLGNLPLEERLQLSKKIQKKYPEVVWAVSSHTQAISIQMVKNYTYIKKWNEDIERIYSKHGLLGDEGVTSIMFPFKLTDINRFFDFSSLLEKNFGLGIHKHERFFGDKKLWKTNLSNIEKRVYYGLICHPELSDKELAQKIFVSRPTIAKIKKRFEGKLLRTVRIVNLEKMCFQMLVFIHLKFKPGVANKNIKNGFIKSFTNSMQPVLLILGTTDCVMLIPFKDFDEYTKAMSTAVENYKKYGILKSIPNTLLFSFSELKEIRKHIYASVVKKALGI
ncbi:MAG: hypothetical protein KKE04_03295 [Candidatus Thermoplasmatota archaeon]|nr:hypothetical protein [Candidatus Thermoplasmatota archaeon]